MHPITFEIIIFMFWALILGTQIIIPALRGRPLFPIKRLWKQEASLQDAKTDVIEAQMEVETIAERRRAEVIRKANQKQAAGAVKENQ